MARRLGFRELVNIGSLQIPYLFMGMVIRCFLIQQNPELVKSFLKAYVAGLKVAIEQPKASKRSLAKYLATKDPEIVEEAHRSLRRYFQRFLM